ncbi:MAG: lipopolysaccharide heptosyltransferase II, partial [Verrucomicrobia bacterium]|nr:lipopolysaccharide heptosyltransferase II [Verrucomicrobiota bacterium]
TAFGGELSRAQMEAVGREHFAAMVGNVLAGACLSRVPAAELRKLVEVEGFEHFSEAVAGGKGVVALLGHLGNWELLARLTPQMFPCESGSVYQALSNEHVDAWVRRQREAEGLRLFERKEGFHSAMDLLRRGGVVGVLADQHAGDSGLWCPLFQRLASTSPLVATMALRTGAAVVGIALYTAPRGRWRLVFRPAVLLPKDTSAATARLNLELEAMIRFQPSDWLWSHNRWKTPHPRFLSIGGKRGLFSGGNLRPFRLLVRSVNWLGDAVMTLPAVRAMKRTRPDLQITVACQEKLAGFWRAVPEVDHVLALPSGVGIRRAAALMSAERFDAAVVLPNSLRTGLEVWLAGIPRRVGYRGHFRAALFNQLLEKKGRAGDSSAPRHQVYDYLELAESMGAPRLEPEEWVTFRPPGSGWNASGVRRVAVCPGAEFGSAKRWFPERFAEVIERVSGSHAVEWVLVGVSKDAPAGAAIEAALPLGKGIVLENKIGRTRLDELLECLRGCEVLLTNDTGTMHLAAMLGVRVVAIFGSTEPRLTGPLGLGHTVLQHRVPCGPCFQRECHLDMACMKGVGASEVAQALEVALLQDPRPQEVAR